MREGGGTQRLVPISSTRFGVDASAGTRIDFELADGQPVALTFVNPDGERTRLAKQATESAGRRPRLQ